MANHDVELGCEALGASEVLRLRGREAMNELPVWELEVSVASPPSSPADLVMAPAVLRLADPLEGAERSIELVVCEVAELGRERAGYRLAVKLAPLACRALYRAGYRIFLDRGSHQIVEQVMTDAGVPADRFELRLAAEYTLRTQCTQYAESDFAFVERLLAEEGINFWFDDGEGGTKLLLGDDMGSHDGIPPPLTLGFEDASGLVRARSFSSLERSVAVATERVLVRDYDVRNPDVLVEGRAGDGPLSYFEYPSFAPTERAAAVRAKARLEQLRRFAVELRGTTDCMRLRPGRLVQIDGADPEMHGEHLVVAVEHRYERPSPDDTRALPYRNSVALVPRGEAAFRPALPTARPRLEHVDSAIVTGPPGEEIHVDDLGRTKLRFFWDPSGKTDDTTSAWARTAQWQQTGSMQLPRVGWEVPVMYVDGSPDRPFVLGRAYNGQRVPPYLLPKSAAVSAIRTDTTPFDGTMQEIRLTDDAGQQQFRIQASRDQSVAVGGSSETRVAANETQRVGGMLSHVIDGSQTHTISGSQTVGVGTQAAKKVDGPITLTVAAAQRIGVAGNRGVGAGARYTELIGAGYLLQCNQSNTRTTGGFAQINGSTSVAAAMGFGEQIAGSRVELVGGGAQYGIGGTYKDTTTGPKIVLAGAATESAGAGVATKAKVGSIQAGSATVSAGGEISVSGTAIHIKVGSLVAGALTMGGSFQVGSGTLELRAPSIDYLSNAHVGG